MNGSGAVEGYGDSRVKDPRDWVRFNGAPSQDFWITRKHPKTGENQRDRMTWGLKRIGADGVLTCRWDGMVRALWCLHLKFAALRRRQVRPELLRIGEAR